MKRGITFNLSGKEVWIHESLVSSWMVVIVITILALYINKKVKQTDPTEKPKGVVHIVEVLVTGVESLITQVMGSENLHFGPYMLSLGLFLAFANLWGLLGFMPPTADYNVTLALALVTFMLIHVFSFKTKGALGYFKQFGEPIPILLPINILGEIAAPISLSFRLFGNILAGALIMGLVYQGLKNISVFLIPIVAAPLHAYFDVFSGLLQTFIFLMLSMSYIKNNLGE